MGGGLDSCGVFSICEEELRAKGMHDAGEGRGRHRGRQNAVLDLHEARQQRQEALLDVPQRQEDVLGGRAGGGKKTQVTHRGM